MEFQPFIKPLYFCKLITHKALRSLNMFMYSGSNWKLEVLVFEERGKAEYLKKYLIEQRREPTTTKPTNSINARIWAQTTLVGGKSSHHSATLEHLSTQTNTSKSQFQYWNTQEFLAISSVHKLHLHFQNINNILHLHHSLCFQRNKMHLSPCETYEEFWWLWIPCGCNNYSTWRRKRDWLSSLASLSTVNSLLPDTSTVWIPL